VAVRIRCAAWESDKQSNQNPNYMSETKNPNKKDIRDLKPNKDAKGGGTSGSSTAGRGTQKPQ
jgi:hypothetical protein